MYRSLKRLLVVVILIFFKVAVTAQYINTDSIMIVSGSKTPLLLEQLEKLEEQSRFENRSYLSKFLLPGNGGYIISRFGPRSGRMHYGTDIRMNRGDTIVASQSGTVVRAGWGTGWGNLIILQHKNNIQTYYAHQTRFLVKVGDRVAKGEPIGLVGSTGRARGPHLHFEIRENEKPFDPEMIFDFKKNKIREDAFEVESLVQLHKKLKPKGYANNLAVPEYYKVRSGDTLWQISRKYKTSIKTICSLNKIKETAVLQIGQPLRMY